MGSPVRASSGVWAITILGRGVYGLAEAAKLTGLRPARVRAWFRAKAKGPGVFESDYPTVGGQKAISFLDLVEVLIAGWLRAAEPPVSLQHIRKVHRKMRLDTGLEHPFCSREIFLSRGKIFTRRTEDPETHSIIDPLTDQSYFNAVIMPFLSRIEYDDATRMARIWRIAEGVVIDPARCFGKPIVEAVGIATRVLAAAYEANGRDAPRVADWYEIEPIHVEAAVDFEAMHAA